MTKGGELKFRATRNSWLKSVLKLQMLRVLALRMLVVVKLLRKLLVEQTKLRLRKRKKTSNSSGSGRNQSQRSPLVKSILRRSLARSNWQRRLVETLKTFLLLQ